MRDGEAGRRCRRDGEAREEAGRGRLGGRGGGGQGGLLGRRQRKAIAPLEPAACKRPRGHSRPLTRAGPPRGVTGTALARRPAHPGNRSVPATPLSGRNTAGHAPSRPRPGRPRPLVPPPAHPVPPRSRRGSLQLVAAGRGRWESWDCPPGAWGATPWRPGRAPPAPGWGFPGRSEHDGTPAASSGHSHQSQSRRVPSPPGRAQGGRSPGRRGRQ